MSGSEPIHTRWDATRADRIGIPEAILCHAKSADQIGASVRARAAEGASVLLTRLSPHLLEELEPDVKDLLDYDSLSSTAILGEPIPVRPAQAVAIVAAGTSDLPAAAEAMRTLEFHGVAADLIVDVGVAGLHRLLEELERIRRAPVVIAVAGMEGALFSVIGGLVRAPVIALPTSTGYGVGAGGWTALHAALGSCSPGLGTVNIDNGYGAACLAIRMLGVTWQTSDDRRVRVAD